MTATVFCASRAREIPSPRVFTRTGDWTFVGTSALLFTASATLTILWCASMSSMAAMPMPGGWSMSPAWMRMPGQTWTSAAALFLGMWIVMMVAMMLPSLIPTLRRYRRALGWPGKRRLGRLTALVGAGYFCVWAELGLVVFPLGTMLATIEMRIPALARSIPVTIGLVVLGAGALQFTTWKAHHLACARESMKRDDTLRPSVRTAWNHGLRVGLHCMYCCAGLTTILIVLGVMDLRTMVIVTAAITIERLAPAGQRAAQAIGILAGGAGLLLIARASGLG